MAAGSAGEVEDTYWRSAKRCGADGAGAGSDEGDERSSGKSNELLSRGFVLVDPEGRRRRVLRMTVFLFGSQGCESGRLGFFVFGAARKDNAEGGEKRKEKTQEAA